MHCSELLDLKQKRPIAILIWDKIRKIIIKFLVVISFKNLILDKRKLGDED